MMLAPRFHGLELHCFRGMARVSAELIAESMHHQRAEQAKPGDNVGLNIETLDKQNMPRSDDVMVYKKDTTLGHTKEFDAQIQVLDIPNEIKVGYPPIGFVRCGRSACRIAKLKWKMGKKTGGKKMEDSHSPKSNEMAQCSFQPRQPLVCDSFKNCKGLSRVAFMDGNTCVMLGKVISCEKKELGHRSFQHQGRNHRCTARTSSPISRA